MAMRLETMVRECVGRTMVDSAGDEIGTIQAVFVDETTAEPEWFAVRTGRANPRVAFLPVAAASVNGAAVQSLYSRDTVLNSPPVEGPGHVTPDEQRALFEYYDGTDVADVDPVDLDGPSLTPSGQLANDTAERPLVGDDSAGGSADR